MYGGVGGYGGGTIGHSPQMGMGNGMMGIPPMGMGGGFGMGMGMGIPIGGEMGILLVSKHNTYLFGFWTLIFSLGQTGIKFILGNRPNDPFYN